jgi:dihydroorotate dehydrogenase electron transfer subunit
MKKLVARIISNKEVSQKFYRMRLKSAYLAKTAKPGQFVEVRCSNDLDPLLRRPFGVHRINTSGIEMLYEVVGNGTEILSHRKAGSILDMIGPLGNGFDALPSKTAILVAGGIGVAPLMALAEKLAIGKKKKIFVIVGARTRSHILCEKEFKSIGCSVKIVTEDGSKGPKGLATDLLKESLSAGEPRPEAIYACGPTGMLKAVAAIAKAYRVPCQVSLEERMACGVGVCLGCPVKVRPDGGYRMVCKDGPVFNAEEIAW